VNRPFGFGIRIRLRLVFDPESRFLDGSFFLGGGRCHVRQMFGRANVVQFSARYVPEDVAVCLVARVAVSAVHN